MITTERVIDILTKEGGYRSLEKPVTVGTQAFNFTQVLVAHGKGNDLVIVIELTGSTDNAAVIRSVLAFTRALDVLGSRRSVTAVLTSGQADKDLINGINRVCRVLPVGSPSGQDAADVVRDWLAVLLPLKSPPPVEHLADWKTSLDRQLVPHLDDLEIGRFVHLAERGKDAVEGALATEIASLADKALDEDGA